MKKTLSLLMILALLATACLFAVGCGQTEDPDTDPAVVGAAASYVVLDINPTVEMTLSEEDVVVSVSASNDDAAVLLDQAPVEGKELEEATEILADASIELGFIKEGENTEISITVVGDTAAVEEAVFGKIKEMFCSRVEEKCHFNLGVERDVLLSLEKELEELKAANPDNEAIQALNVAHYRMIVSAMEKDATLTLEVALTMKTRDLIRIIRDGTLEHIEEAFERHEIMAEYEMQKIKDSIYAEMGIYMQVEGVQLTALRELEHQIELLDECEFEKLERITLTAEDVAHIASLLGLTGEDATAFVEKCCGLDGTYTVHNLKYAINRLHRNLPKSERDVFEDKYDLVEDYIETLENRVTVPEYVVAALKMCVDRYNTIAPNHMVTMPESFANLEELDVFLEAFEEAIEEQIEEIEEILEEKIEDADLEEEFERRMEAIEAELEAKEDEMEREHNKIKNELETEFRENIDKWMDRHHGNGNGNGGRH